MKLFTTLFFIVLLFALSPEILAQASGQMPGGMPGGIVDIKISGDSLQLSPAIKIIIFVTLLSIAPAIILTMTSFTRVVIVLSFLRQAIGIQQSPPNQVIVGLSLFITFFIMSPVITQVHQNAVSPLLKDQISLDEAIEKGSGPIKKFMFLQTRNQDIDLMLNLSRQKRPNDFNDLKISTLIPAFLISELRTAFEMAFLIYLPFVLVDMVVAMVLLSMGMMMLPPVIVSLPFKLMLFVLVDGWNLIIGSLVRSFK